MLASWHGEIVTVRMAIRISPLICRSFQRTLIKNALHVLKCASQLERIQKLPGGM